MADTIKISELQAASAFTGFIAQDAAGTNRTEKVSVAQVAAGVNPLLDHGGFQGLGGDDHTQYSLADGSRAFTGPVAGVNPVNDQDLVTKIFIENFADEFIRKDGTVPFTGSPDFGEFKGTNAAPGVAPTDLATVGQLGGAINNVLTVGEGGAGVKYTSIETAIAAASGETTIEINNGTYASTAKMVLGNDISLKSAAAFRDVEITHNASLMEVNSTSGHNSIEGLYLKMTPTTDNQKNFRILSTSTEEAIAQQMKFENVVAGDRGSTLVSLEGNSNTVIKDSLFTYTQTTKNNSVREHIILDINVGGDGAVNLSNCSMLIQIEDTKDTIRIIRNTNSAPVNFNAVGITLIIPATTSRDSVALTNIIEFLTDTAIKAIGNSTITIYDLSPTTHIGNVFKISAASGEFESSGFIVNYVNAANTNFYLSDTSSGGVLNLNALSSYGLTNLERQTSEANLKGDFRFNGKKYFKEDVVVGGVFKTNSIAAETGSSIDFNDIDFDNVNSVTAGGGNGVAYLGENNFGLAGFGHADFINTVAYGFAQTINGGMGMSYALGESLDIRENNDTAKRVLIQGGALTTTGLISEAGTLLEDKYAEKLATGFFLVQDADEAEAGISSTVYVSPGDDITPEGTPQNFTYSGGSLTYTGTETAKMLVQAAISFSSTGTNMTNNFYWAKNWVSGASSTPRSLMIRKTSSADIPNISVPFAIELSTGDTLDLIANNDDGTQTLTFEQGSKYFGIRIG